MDTVLSGSRPRFRRALLTAGAVVASLALSACGSSGDNGARDDLNPQNGPLAKLLGYDISPAEQREKELDVQQFLVECMRTDGWEYEAVDYNASNPYQDEYAEQIADPKAYGEKYGYGVARGYELNGDGGGGNEFVDPNQDYVESLSGDEETEYYASLYGKQDDQAVSEGDVYVPPPLEEQGCYGKAQADVYGESPYNDPDISTRLNELFEDSANDPAIADANEVWATCMGERDASYEWASPDAIYQYLYDKLSELQGITPATFEEGSSGGSVVVAGTDAVDGGGGQPEPIADADLEELRAEELQIWNDDQACQSSADLAQVRRDVEQRMVDDLIADFPELGDG